jgi:hypothetical protein
MKITPHHRPAVRVFPDYAGTVIWFICGPIDYDDACLTSALVLDMQAWEQKYYANLTDEYVWREGFDAEEYIADGIQLAQRLANEIGDILSVELITDMRTITLFGEGNGTNPRARAAFLLMAEESLPEGPSLKLATRDGVEVTQWATWQHDSL